MADKTIRVIQVGAGATGKATVRYLTERGCEVVACVDAYCHEGEDIGVLAGIGSLGITVEKDLAAALERTRPDIATVCTVSELHRVYPLLKTIVEHGVNVVTLAEEAFFPRAVDSKLTDDLDTLAKKHQVTVLGTGMQDLFWQSLSLVLAGGVHKIRAIRGANRAVGDGSWGKTNADAVYAGWTVEEYEAAQKQSAREGELEQRSIFGVALHSMAEEMGLHVKSLRPWHTPIISTWDHYIPEIDRMIPKGYICGIEEGCELETEEGIILSGVLYDQYTNPGDTAMNRWDIEGEPNISLVIEDVRGDVTPFSILTTRVPDVMNAEPGFLTCKDMPKFAAKPLPLPQYLT